MQTTPERNPGLGYLQHFLVKIQPDSPGAMAREGKSEVAGPATDIESGISGLNVSQADHFAFPIAMQAETLQVIDQIIALRDYRKELVHFFRPLLAWDEEWISHAAEPTAKIFPKHPF